jgi:hypothetical protein
VPRPRGSCAAAAARGLLSVAGCRPRREDVSGAWSRCWGACRVCGCGRPRGPVSVVLSWELAALSLSRPRSLRPRSAEATPSARHRRKAAASRRMVGNERTLDVDIFASLFGGARQSARHLTRYPRPSPDCTAFVQPVKHAPATIVRTLPHLDPAPGGADPPALRAPRGSAGGQMTAPRAASGGCTVRRETIDPRTGRRPQPG